MRVGVRDYDPGLGRFLSVDPVLDVADPVQWNPYVYADNSPVTKSDPSGLRPVDFTAEMWKAHKAARSHGASRARADAAAFGTPSGRAGGNAHVSRRGISSALLRRLGLSSYEDAEANVRAATRWNRLPDPGPLPPTHAEQVGPIGTVVEVLATAAVVLFAPEVVASVVANPWAVVTAIADSYAGGSMLAGSAGAAVGSAALRYEANLTTKSGDEFVNLASQARTTHILQGDATGGGHLWPGGAGKSPFPQSWSGDRIMHEISDIATDPAAWRSGVPQGGRTILTGTRDGVDIRVVVDTRTGEIITGYPTNVPRNP